MAMRDKGMLRVLIDLLHLEDGVLRFVGALFAILSRQSILDIQLEWLIVAVPGNLFSSAWI